MRGKKDMFSFNKICVGTGNEVAGWLRGFTTSFWARLSQNSD